MSIWEKIFGYPAINQLPGTQKQEVKKLLDQLVKIGQMDDFLSLQPGGPFTSAVITPRPARSVNA